MVVRLSAKERYIIEHLDDPDLEAKLVPERKPNSRKYDISKAPHGTANGYNNYRCRCQACTAAHAKIKREYYERMKNARIPGHDTTGLCN